MEKKMIQRSIASLALIMLVALALRPTATNIGAGLLIGAAVAWAVFSDIYNHHKKGNHKKAARSFWRVYAVFGILLFVFGALTLILTNTLMPVLDIALGTSMALYGGRKYATLRA